MSESFENMKETIAAKEATIEELKSRLGRRRGEVEEDLIDEPFGVRRTDGRKEDVAVLTRALREREDQIEELQEKLAEASR
jgi:predicted RNase H-like nuclease (RuvC/YqgF family)